MDGEVPIFDRGFLTSSNRLSRIGRGSLGGKATGLVRALALVEGPSADARAAGWRLSIPRAAVLGTGAYEAFMERNGLHALVAEEPPDHRLALAFQQGSLPAEIVGDLRSLVEATRVPLAVRSSSLLEDALERPFAGVYETKMIPNAVPSPDDRFRQLAEAVKLVWASTWFAGARTYRMASGAAAFAEQMAVMVQEVMGARRGERFYPDVSAVCRSYNYYPSGRARPEEGVVSLALGLGKTIVDGGLCWTYSPRHPKAPPPFASTRAMLQQTQARFWAIHMGPPPAWDPTAETEFMVEAELAAAEEDGTLGAVSSTYDPEADRVVPGIGRDGPRVLDFAPLLHDPERPLNDLILRLLEDASAALGQDVEMELAAVLPRGNEPGRLGVVQVRAMRGAGDEVPVPPEALHSAGLLCSSPRAMGNGVERGIQDVVYLRPEAFDRAHTRRIAAELARWNGELLRQERPYVLIGFGRWGSSDPWLGVPVTWSQVAGARVMAEAALPGMGIEASQGSHFFHNLASFGVKYFTVAEGGVDWSWLAGCPEVEATELLRHVRTPEPLVVMVDGRSGRGVIWKSEGDVVRDEPRTG